MEFVNRAADTGCACNDAHAGGQFEPIHRFAQFLTFFAFDTAGNTAPAGVVRHQNEVAAGKRNEGRQSGAFIAALFFFDLND